MSLSLSKMQVVWVWLSVLALTVPVAAQAQLEPEVQLGSRVPVKPKKVDKERTGQIMHDFGKCVYGRYPAKANSLLQNSDPVSIDYAAAGIDPKKIELEFGMSDCLGQSAFGTQSRVGATFKGARLRSLLAEEAYLAAHTKAPQLDVTAIEAAERKYFSKKEFEPQARALALFADCLVFHDTERADAILRTMPGSKDERVAAGALAPTLGKCLAQGQTIELTAASIRSIAADGLWTRFVRTPSAVAVESR